MADNIQKQNTGRIHPHSSEAEEAVLGCMLINNKSVPKAVQLLNKNSFYNTANQIIFSNMIELFEKNKNIDYVSLIDQLSKNKQLKEVGDAYYITGLSTNAPSAENIEYYAEIVRDKYILRQIIQVAINISNEAYESKEEDLGLKTKYLYTLNLIMCTRL